MNTPHPIDQNEIFGESNLQRIYRSRFGGNLAYRNSVWDVLTRNYFQTWVAGEATVLDLGAGYCEFINNIQSGKKYALDLNPDTAHYASSDVTVLSQDCSRPWPLADDSLDVVFTSNFFEHVSDKETLVRILNEAFRCIKPGGALLAMGPNVKYLPGLYWDFWDHHIALTEHSLSEALTQSHFTIETCIDKFLPYTMSGGLQYPLFFVATYLRVPFLWRFFGKQFLLVARKPQI